MSLAEYDPSFPRNQWPQATYICPGLRSASWHTRIRFVAQRASVIVAEALRDDRLAVISEADFSAAVLDVVLELVDIMRDESRETNRSVARTVDKWHKWIRKVTREVVQDARALFTEHSIEAVERLDTWDAGRREQLIIGCMDRLWIKRDTDEWFNRGDRSLYGIDDLHALVERYGPSEMDKKKHWHGFSINLDDLSTRTLLVDAKGERTVPVDAEGQEVGHAIISVCGTALTLSATATPSPPLSSAPSLRGSTSEGEHGSESPSSCSPRSAKSAKVRDCSDSHVVVIADPDARDADDEQHLSVEPAKSATGGVDGH